MALIFSSHGKSIKTPKVGDVAEEGLVASEGQISINQQADFGYLFPYDQGLGVGSFLLEGQETLDALDGLAELMVDQKEVDETGSSLPAILTYWGQFLDHELTLGTDSGGGENSLTDEVITPRDHLLTEAGFKNARSPRFDLDSVYGGMPLFSGVDSEKSKAAAKVISAMRDSGDSRKMLIGKATPTNLGPIPDDLEIGLERDLPRFGQVSDEINDALRKIYSEAPKDNEELNKLALIGDKRNEENLIVAQFHLSFLHFHNKIVDFLDNDGSESGWVSDYDSAKSLTKLHYQWLIVNGYLKSICDDETLDAIISDKAKGFFDFRAMLGNRLSGANEEDLIPDNLGNAIPIEFSVAAFRFGHTMVRDAYDFNINFPDAEFDLLFGFTAGGDFLGQASTLPQNWIIDWSRFIAAEGASAPERPARSSRAIDTSIAPPLKSMSTTAKDVKDPNIRELLKHLARRNMRRGYDFHLSTGQAMHRFLKDNGLVSSDVINDVTDIFTSKPEFSDFFSSDSSRSLNTSTPLWFYILAEAERNGGNKLGQVGSWIVASTFIGTLLSDPDSALSIGFEPSQSPIKMEDNSEVDTIAKWLQFAGVMA